jgi:hypothetical protein
MNRNNIIKTLTEALEPNTAVFALWLEGADSTGALDEFSDIDIVADVKDGEEDNVYAEVDRVLSGMGKLDLNYRSEQGGPLLRYRIYHLENTPDHLLIDVNIQSHSRDFKFTKGNRAESPYVLFDKAGVIKFKGVSEQETKRLAEERLAHIKAAFFQRSTVRKYIKRQKFLEALAYYHKKVLEPLVELVRLIHTPLISDYHLVHISDHIPKELVGQIEELYKVTSLQEIEHKLGKAEALFEKMLGELVSQ